MKHLSPLTHRLLRDFAENKSIPSRSKGGNVQKARDKLVRIGFINEHGAVTSAGHNYLRRYDNKNQSDRRNDPQFWQ